jgi:hypothetical protein
MTRTTAKKEEEEAERKGGRERKRTLLIQSHLRHHLLRLLESVGPLLIVEAIGGEVGMADDG